MAEVQFSRDDIERLVDRLSTLSSQLSDREQLLLLAILSVAADHASQPARAGQTDIPAGATLAELREQIVRSFVPGPSEEFIFLPATKIGGR